jgi:hypothetical protein
MYNVTYEHINRFGCSSPAAATDEYQAVKGSGMHLPIGMYNLNSSTWTCPGSGGGSAASCNCLELGTAEFIGTGPFPANHTFVICMPI